MRLEVRSALAFLTTAIHARGQSYSLSEIGKIGINVAQGGYNLGLNDLGTVVGTNSAGHAFMYVNGSMTDLGTMDGGTSGASGINSEGTIIGSGSVAAGGYNAFMYSHGSMNALTTSALNTIATHTRSTIPGLSPGAQQHRSLQDTMCP